MNTNFISKVAKLIFQILWDFNYVYVCKKEYMNNITFKFTEIYPKQFL